MAVVVNANDGITLKPQMEQIKELTGGKIKKSIVERGYRIKKGIMGIKIVMPKTLKREIPPEKDAGKAKPVKGRNRGVYITPETIITG